MNMHLEIKPKKKLIQTATFRIPGYEMNREGTYKPAFHPSICADYGY